MDGHDGHMMGDHSMHAGHETHGDPTMLGHEMHMAFYVGNEVTILFKGWTTTTGAQMFGACVGVFLFALLFEALRAFRDYLYSKSRTDSSTSLISGVGAGWVAEIVARRHLLQTALYAIQITHGYSLMLLFMTYNLYICAAIVLGATVGFLLFGWNKNLMLDMTGDHCG